jgi:exopolysaccharide production protein ExoZ
MPKEPIIETANPGNYRIRFHYLDLLRLIAAMGVILFHVAAASWTWTTNLYLMVDLFFVLSGFVLAPIFPRSGRWQGFFRFALKRLLRLLPMAWLSLFFIALYSGAILLKSKWSNDPDLQLMPISAESFLMALLLMQIFSTAGTLLNYPLWSLSAEWLANVFLALSLNFLTFRDTLKISLIFGFLGIVFSATVTDSEGLSQLSRALFGISLGMLLRNSFEARMRVKNLSTKLFCSFLSCICILVLDLELGFAIFILAGLVFGALVYFIAFAENEYQMKVPQAFAHLCGALSFGLYVWHVPLAGIVEQILSTIGIKGVGVNYVALVFAGVLASIPSIYLVERPLSKYIKGRIDVN